MPSPSERRLRLLRGVSAVAALVWLGAPSWPEQIDDQLITPMVEGLAAVVWHLLVSHPLLAQHKGHWEQVAAGAKQAVNG